MQTCNDRPSLTEYNGSKQQAFVRHAMPRMKAGLNGTVGSGSLGGFPIVFGTPDLFYQADAISAHISAFYKNTNMIKNHDQ